MCSCISEHHKVYTEDFTNCDDITVLVYEEIGNVLNKIHYHLDCDLFVTVKVIRCLRCSTNLPWYLSRYSIDKTLREGQGARIT